MYLGIEIGGTKLQAGLGRGAGGPLLERFALGVVDKARGQAGILATLARELPAILAARPEVAALGVGFGGPIQYATGMVLRSHQVGGWDGFDIPAEFARRFGKPTHAGNDSDLAGWWEAVHGAGAGCSPVLYMNIGTGIGGALVVDGQLYAAQGLGSAELGHLRMLPGVPLATLEELAAGPALDRKAMSLGLADGRELAAAAQAGDVRAAAAWAGFVELWASALANAATLLCPRVIVLGGGVAANGDLLLKPVEAAFRRLVFEQFAAPATIAFAVAREQQWNVVHGAAMLAAARNPTR